MDIVSLDCGHMGKLQCLNEEGAVENLSVKHTGAQRRMLGKTLMSIPGPDFALGVCFLL